jgi:hypothetical protein
MEKNQIIAKIYGYMICLVAVITFLICITDLVNSIIDRCDPIHADRYSSSTNLASFETYKMDLLKETKSEGDTSKATFIPDDKTMKAMYETVKAEQMQSSLHKINRNIVVDSLLIVICIILFGLHWRWMRKLAKAGE